MKGRVTLRMVWRWGEGAMYPRVPAYMSSSPMLPCDLMNQTRGAPAVTRSSLFFAASIRACLRRNKAQST